MNDVIHPVHGLHQPVTVADVADEVTHAVAMKVLLHLELLELIARIDDQPSRPVPLEQRTNVHSAERTGAAGDQYGLAVEHATYLSAASCRLTAEWLELRAGYRPAKYTARCSHRNDSRGSYFHHTRHSRRRV